MNNNDSTMTKDGDKTEVQDFTKAVGMASSELQGGSFANLKQQSDSQGSQTGSILDIEPAVAVITTEEEERKEDINLYTSNDSFKDGVNEMIEDEAHMAQKTAYYLQ